MSDDTTLTADVPGADTGGLTQITLAHRLSEADLRTLHLDPEAVTRPGTKIAVRREQAQSLIGAGYALGVDSEDRKAVAAALSGKSRDEVTTDDDKPHQATGPTEEPVPPQGEDVDNVPVPRNDGEPAKGPSEESGDTGDDKPTKRRG